MNVSLKRNVGFGDNTCDTQNFSSSFASLFDVTIVI